MTLYVIITIKYYFRLTNLKYLDCFAFTMKKKSIIMAFIIVKFIRVVKIAIALRTSNFLKN